MNSDYQKMMKYVEKSWKVAVYGCGADARRFILRLQRDGHVVAAVFDSNPNKEGNLLRGVRVSKPYRLEGETVYVIATSYQSKAREEMKETLLEGGVCEDDVFFYSNYEYMRGLEEDEYKDEIKVLYEERFEKQLDWDNPRTFNAWLNIDKVCGMSPLKTKCADKIEVREFVKERIGTEYLTHIYGTYDNVEEIRVASLPEAFALKMNHGSGMNIIVRDKTFLDWSEACTQLNHWKQINHCFSVGLETQYRDIRPRILCEEYLEGVAESVYDYDVFCFHGEPRYVCCLKESHRKGARAGFYDTDWNKIQLSWGWGEDAELAPRPDRLDDILELSRRLSDGFDHVRVDWIIMPDGRIIFSELTFTTWAGLSQLIPDKWDEMFYRIVQGLD